MRRAVPFAILAGCLGVGVLPALAADGSVAIHDSFFSPSQVAVLPGESVTWQAAGTTRSHNVHFDGEVAPVGAPSASFSGTRQFAAAGTFRYHCDVHASMTGAVYVNATGTVPTPAPTASPTASPTAAPTRTPAPGGGTPTPAPGPGVDSRVVSSFSARAVRGRFCTRRSARCRTPGVFLLIDLGASEPVRVRGTLRRGSKRVRAVSLRVRPGARRVRLPGRRLKPGRYALTLRAGDITRRVRFRVRGS